MKQGIWEKNRGLICAAGITVVYFAVLLFFYQPLFAMNDDMMFESIFSGSYQRPYARSYYVSSLLGLMFSTFYRVAPGIPWLGLGYLFGNVLCFAVIQVQAFAGAGQRENKSVWKFVPYSVFGALAMTALCFQSFVLLHYTMLAALFGATGLFLIAFTNDKKQYPLAGSLILLCYLIRENVFFMLCPFLMVLVLNLIMETKGKNLKKEMCYSLLFGGAFLLLFAGNKLSFGEASFREYLEYNDLRTQLYDYLGVSTDEQARQHYASQGISEEDFLCIRSYDLALIRKEQGGREALQAVVSYEKQRKQKDTFDLGKTINVYLHRFLLQREDRPWNLVAVACYVLLASMSIFGRKLWKLIPLGMLGIFRSILWMYLLEQGRYPQRVTLSLYFMEIAILIGFILRELSQFHFLSKRLLKTALCIVTFAIFMGLSVRTIKEADAQYQSDMKINRDDDLLMDYINQHPDRFYFLDVYAVVNRTQKALSGSRDGWENYMYAGGWMVGHPLYLEKLDGLQSGARNAAEILCERENTYFVIKERVGMTIEDLELILGAKLKIRDTVKGEQVSFHVLEIER